MTRSCLKISTLMLLAAISSLYFPWVAVATADPKAAPSPDVKEANIVDIREDLKRLEARINALSVKVKFDGFNTDGSHPDIRAHLTNVESSTVERSGRGRLEIDGQTFRINDGKAVIRPSKQMSTNDGVLLRSVSGITSLSAGLILKSPGSLGGWTVNPFEMTTLFHGSPVSEIISKRNGKIVGRVEHDGHDVVVIQTDTLTNNGIDWSSRFLIDPALKNAVVRRCQLIRFPPSEKWMELDVIDCHDHREVATGVWLPSRVEIRTASPTEENARTGSKPRLAWEWNGRIENWVVNPPVTDSLFVLEFPPGAVVEDQVKGRVDTIPPLEDKPRPMPSDSLVGKPAPAFPEGATWINGEPLTWQSLGGKIVILDFFAEWCGPCRKDYPQLSRLHGERGANGLTVVGIHPPGSKSEAIKKVIDEFHLDYPVCVDVAIDEKSKGWGKLYRQFKIDLIPHAVAVDGRGMIVASGRLDDVIAKASELVKGR